MAVAATAPRVVCLYLASREGELNVSSPFIDVYVVTHKPDNNEIEHILEEKGICRITESIRKNVNESLTLLVDSSGIFQNVDKTTLDFPYDSLRMTGWGIENVMLRKIRELLPTDLESLPLEIWIKEGGFAVKLAKKSHPANEITAGSSNSSSQSGCFRYAVPLNHISPAAEPLIPNLSTLSSTLPKTPNRDPMNDSGVSSATHSPSSDEDQQPASIVMSYDQLPLLRMLPLLPTALASHNGQEASQGMQSPPRFGSPHSSEDDRDLYSSSFQEIDEQLLS